jgi:hypothetical protein
MFSRRVLSQLHFFAPEPEFIAAEVVVKGSEVSREPTHAALIFNNASATALCLSPLWQFKFLWYVFKVVNGR